MTKQTELLLREYEHLNQEIATADTQNYQAAALVVAAVGAILTTGFNQPHFLQRVFIFASAFAVTIPCYRLLQANRRRIWRASTYMRVFLEPRLGYLRWQTRLHARASMIARSSDKNGRDRPRRQDTELLGSLFLIVFLANLFVTGALCYALAQGKLLGLIWCLLLLFALISVNGAVTLSLHIGLQRLGVAESEYERQWRQLQEQESVSLSSIAETGAANGP